MQPYTIHTITKHSENILHASVSINPLSEVFIGHFPGRPILPGVIHLKIVLEILNKYYDKYIAFHTCSNIKFLHFIDPTIVANINFEIFIKNNTESSSALDVIVKNDQSVFCKMQNLYVERF